MEWIGWIALIILLCYSSYPGKVQRLEAQMKKVERKLRGESEMSKLINSLVGTTCKIKSNEALAIVGVTIMDCLVLDADDEWIKIKATDKKKNTVIKLIRIETIDDIEVLEEESNE